MDKATAGGMGMGRKKNNYIFMEQKPKRRAPGCLILLLAVVFAIIALSIISNSLLNQRIHLNTEKVRIMGMDSGNENVTILHISDLHGSDIGFKTEQWEDLLYGRGFTAVVMTGDMVGASGDYAPMISLIRTLRQIKEGVPIYFIAGDEDPVAVDSACTAAPNRWPNGCAPRRLKARPIWTAPSASRWGKKPFGSSPNCSIPSA